MITHPDVLDSNPLKKPYIHMLTVMFLEFQFFSCAKIKTLSHYVLFSGFSFFLNHSVTKNNLINYCQHAQKFLFANDEPKYYL